MRLALTSLLFLLWSVPAAAQSEDHTLLWRIEGKALHSPSYLYGTIHITKRKVFYYEPGGVGVVLPDKVEETLWNTDDAWDKTGTDAQAKEMLKRQEQREKENEESGGSGDDD